MKLEASELIEYVGNCVKINNHCTADFQSWFNRLCRNQKNDTNLIFTQLSKLKLSGYLGDQENAQNFLALEVFYHTYQALRHSNIETEKQKINAHENKKKKFKNMAQRAKELRKVINDIPPILMRVVGPEGTDNPYVYWVTALEKLEDNLNKFAEYPSDMHFNYYGLYYVNKGGKRTNRPSIETVLAYRLEYLFRANTCGWADPNQGMLVDRGRMPAGGKPSREIIANLLNLAFLDTGKVFTSETVKDAIKNLSGGSNVDVGWGPWPLEPTLSSKEYSYRKGVSNTD